MSVVSDSVRPHRRQPTRLPRPWDSPGKNTGVGCHFLLQCMKVKSESEVAQSTPTLRNPMDCSLPGSSINGIFQARVLEWDALAFSVLAITYCVKYGFPGGSDGKESASNMEDLGSTQVGKIPWRKAWQSIPVFLPGESPWTEEPGGLQSMGSQRVRHN